MQVDKSPYAYTWNNPVNLTDPDGRCPWCVGALVGAAADYGLQVAGNFIQGKTGLDAFTDVDGTSIAVSAASGAAGVGIIGKIKQAGTLAKTTKVALEMTTDAALNVTQQVVTKGEVDLTETVVAAASGTVLRGKAQEAINSSAAKKGQQLAKETRTAQRKANNAAKKSSRPGKIQKTQEVADAKAKETQHHQNVTKRKAAASGVISAGAVVKSVKLGKKNQD